MSAVIAGELRAELVRRGLSARAVAAEAGVHPRALQRQLRNDAVHDDIVIRLCDVLDVPYADLVVRASHRLAAHDRRLSS